MQGQPPPQSQDDYMLKLTKWDRKPDPLRKSDPNNWGRFLDNHYVDQLHLRPWNVQMKAPDL